MRGTVYTRVSHECAEGGRRWVRLSNEGNAAKCRECGETATEGEKKYDAAWWAGGRQKYKTFAKKSDAERHLTNMAKMVQDGTYRATQPQQMNKVFDAWWKDIETDEKLGNIKASTVRAYKSMLEQHLRPAFRDYRSDHLTADVVRTWCRTAAVGMSWKYLVNVFALLRVVLGWARDGNYMAHDPAERVRRDLRKLQQKRHRQEARALMPEELERLRKVAESDDLARAVINVAAYSGLRRSEVFALQWADVDSAACRFHVRHNLDLGKLTTPKTKHSVRRVEVPQGLIDLLEEYKESHPPKKAGGFIFHTDGRPIDGDNFYKRTYVPLLIKAGLRAAEDDETVAEDVEDTRAVVFHTLRHTYASMLINDGENLKFVSQQLGHASIQITADRYGHLFPETSTRAMNRLNARFGTPNGKVVTLRKRTAG
jgi:integrase